MALDFQLTESIVQSVNTIYICSGLIKLEWVYKESISAQQYVISL